MIFPGSNPAQKQVKENMLAGNFAGFYEFN